MLKYKENTELISVTRQKAYQNVQKYSWDIYAKNVIDIYKKVTS